MLFERTYLQCLAHASYLVADTESKEALVVDPQRDISSYLEVLNKNGYKLKYILETHVHADFVSGHIELAKKTGASIVYGQNAKVDFPFKHVIDGDLLHLGEGVEVEILETPGHTPESLCYLLKDLNNKDLPNKLLTGDTLFIGDVGRPDLFGSKLPPETMAASLFESIQSLKTLPDNTQVYPAHGAGSACGRSVGEGEYSTIGTEKLSNAALQITDKEKFIRFVTEDLPTPPAYFKDDAALNKQNIKSMDQILSEQKALTVAEVKKEMENGAYIIDTRNNELYAQGAIPGSINIGLEGQFANWVGSLIPFETPILFITEVGQEEEAAIRAARVGFDHTKGYLKGGVEAWIRAGERLDHHVRINPDQILEYSDKDDVLLLDIRKPSERKISFIPKSIHIPLDSLEMRLGELPRDKKIVAYCARGYRSAIAVGILQKGGRTQVTDLRGGFTAYAETITKEKESESGTVI